MLDTVAFSGKAKRVAPLAKAGLIAARSRHHAQGHAHDTTAVGELP
jgi:hypothetical protein